MTESHVLWTVGDSQQGRELKVLRSPAVRKDFYLCVTLPGLPELG
jgi:hypothetical protein